MRRTPTLRRFGLAALAGLAGATSMAVPPAQAAATRDVAYHGYHLAVPAGWPVVDVAKHPDSCVRFDRHAVYLGHPGADQQCPAHLVGRTEAVVVEPLDRRPGSASSTVDHQEVVAVPAAGVLVTGTYGSDRA